MATKRRSSIDASTSDILRTVGILAGVLALLALFFTATRPDPRLPDTVDYEAALEHVRAEYPYPVLAPASLPDGWRATSVDYSSTDRGNRWRLGFLIGESGYVGLEQSDGEIMSYLASRLSDFREDGTVTIEGDEWERRIQQDRSPDRALVRIDDGVVTIVRGPEPYEVLESFAADLES